jgi:aspartokinase
MKIVKFGGKSLANGEGINTVVNIIEGKIKQEEKIAIVVSARGKQLTGRYSYYCSQNGNYKPLLESFKTYQKEVLMQSIFRQNLIN